MLIIGSKALQFRGMAPRAPKDVDLVGSLDDVRALKSQGARGFRIVHGGTHYIFTLNGIIHELELTWDDSTAEQLHELAEQDDDIMEAVHPWYGNVLVPSIDLLYAIKLSHRYKKDSKHFLKTMRDIHFLRSKGARMLPWAQSWLKAREKETYAYAHPNLNVSKDSFFVEAGDVKYVYDHDSIHEAMRHLDRPAYTYFKKDQAEVFTSKDLFFKLPYLTQIYAVLEEAYVLALERSQIPHGELLSPRRSFEIALMKVCTSITSGWFREFAWENYDNVMRMFDHRYVVRFYEQLRIGVVKKREFDDSLLV